MKHEFETISYRDLPHVHIFMNRIRYRRPHFHNAWELGFLLEGSATLTTPGKVTALTPETLVILEPNQIHEISATNEALFLFIQISPRFCREYSNLLKNLSVAQTVIPECPGMIKHQLLEVAKAYWENAEPLRCIGWLSFLLTSLADSFSAKSGVSPANGNHARIAHILDYLNDYYAKPCDLETLAQQEGLSVAYLSGFIRKNLGHSYQQLLQQIRFEHAVRLLDSGNRNLTEVCLASGFSSTRYLNQCFRQHFGITAAQYLQNGENLGQPTNATSVQLEQICSPEDSLRVLEKFL